MYVTSQSAGLYLEKLCPRSLGNEALNIFFLLTNLADSPMCEHSNYQGNDGCVYHCHRQITVQINVRF